MPFYKDIKTLFIHIPKTGGTSLEWYLRRRYSETLFSKSSNNTILPEKQLQDKALQHLPYYNREISGTIRYKIDR